MKRIFLSVVCLCFTLFSMRAADVLNLSSPSGNLRVKFEISDKIYYSLYAGDKLLTGGNSMQVVLKSGILGENPRLQNKKYASVNEEIHPLFPLKFSEIKGRYNSFMGDKINCT